MTSVEFLQQFHPAGPWVLTSIHPEQKGIETDTFFPGDEAQAVRWLDKYVDERNIYFSVNPTIRPMSKKASREDIKAVTWLHVDIDPRAGEDIVEEQHRALGLLQNPPEGVPEATCIVFSGGGYQGFWKLEEPIPINGDLALAEDAKRYNRQLEILLGGDNCHNIDRIMRLPGTWNLPDERKRKKGRTKTLTELVEFHADRVYPLSTFTKAPEVQLPNGAEPRVQISSNIPRLGSVDELDKWNVPDRVRVAIVQGGDPDNPKQGDNSRSAWLFDVVCQLVRCEVPDNVVYSIITDPDLGISKSVLDKGSNAERYALRQIQRAKDEAIDPALAELNDRHAVIENWGGRCRVLEEVYEPALKRDRVTKQSFEDIRNRYMNRQVQIEGKNGLTFKPLGKWWLEHPRRRQYKTIVFSPGEEVEGAYNLWQGFAVEPRPGDCLLFLRHLQDNICSSDPAHYQYLLNWMARGVQQPARPGAVAVVLRGDQGTGKSFFAKQYGALFGRHFLQVSDPKFLVGSFNAHLRDCIVLLGDEAFYAGDKKHEGVLKTLVTEEMLAIEQKGIDVEVAPNYIHLILASNESWVVPADVDDRRFFVLDVSNGQMQNSEYFGAIVRQMKSGGREALLHELLERDLSTFDVRSRPITHALEQQKLHSLRGAKQVAYQVLNSGEAPALLTEGQRIFVASHDLFELRGDIKCSKITISRELAKASGQRTSQREIVNGKQRRGYWLPSLSQARALWAENSGLEVAWPGDDGEWTSVDLPPCSF